MIDEKVICLFLPGDDFSLAAEKQSEALHFCIYLHSALKMMDIVWPDSGAQSVVGPSLRN